MIGHGHINEHIQFLPGPSHADVSTARTGPYHHVGHASLIAAIMTCAAVAPGTVLTVTLLQATSKNGAGSKDLASATFTADGRDDDSPATSWPEVATVAAEVDQLDHNNGFEYVAVKVDTDAACAGAGILALSGLRYGVPES